MRRALPLLFLAVGLAQAATSVTPAGQTGLALLSQTGASLPSTCMIGQLFFNTAAGTGSKIYGCESANTWAVQGGTTVTWASLMTALGVVSPSDSTFPATSGTIATLPALGSMTTYGLVWVDSAGHLGTTSAITGLVKGSGTGYAAATAGTDYVAPIAHGTVVLNPGALTTGTCSSAIDGGTATGVLTTDVIDYTFNADPSAATGYTGVGTLVTLYRYPTADHVNFKVCNWTSSSITPASVTLNWSVRR